MSNANKELYEFENFRLDVSERILWRDDEKLPLSEKAFDTLCALVRRGNHLVSKDELLNEVWAGAFVEENNLDKNISILRNVLGERAGKGKFIETVRGHGFRFVAEVRNVTAVSADESDAEEIHPQINTDEHGLGKMSEPSAVAGGLNSADIQSKTDQYRAKTEVQKPKTENPKSKLFPVALISVLIISAFVAAFYFWKNNSNSASDAKIKSIAVLPFKPLVAENRNESLEFGMADTLISKLSSGGEINVRPINAVRKFNNLEQDSLAAGRELGTEAVLDGTIQTSGDRIRISAKLLRTSDGKSLWTGQFDEKFTDIFAVQDSISEKVIGGFVSDLKRRRTADI